jgi:hypothetical protein
MLSTFCGHDKNEVDARADRDDPLSFRGFDGSD